jgi:hypothetical protein
MLKVWGPWILDRTEVKHYCNLFINRDKGNFLVSDGKNSYCFDCTRKIPRNIKTASMLLDHRPFIYGPFQILFERFVLFIIMGFVGLLQISALIFLLNK